MNNDRRHWLLIALLLLLLLSAGTNSWQYLDSRRQETAIDSLLTQESDLRETLWQNKQAIDLLQRTRDSLFNELAAALEQNAQDSLKIQRFMTDIAQLDHQVDSLERLALSGVDPRWRKYYEDRIAAETEKLNFERERADKLQANLNQMAAFVRKLTTDLNQIQDYLDEISSENLVGEFVTFDARGKPIDIAKNAIGKIRGLQQELDQTQRLLDEYKSEAWAQSMQNQLETYRKRILELEQQIRRYEKILNTAVFACGDLDFLQKNGFATVKKGTFGKKTVDYHPENLREGHPACETTEITQREFELKARGNIVELYPTRDRSSYRIISDVGDPSGKRIIVTNAAEFWKSKMLIVRTE